MYVFENMKVDTFLSNFCSSSVAYEDLILVNIKCPPVGQQKSTFWGIYMCLYESNLWDEAKNLTLYHKNEYWIL